MGASQVPATTGSDNWVQISSVTPTASVSTVSFTSISGYKKLMLRVIKPGFSGSPTTTLTLNSDTGANYAYSAAGISNYTSITLYDSIYGINEAGIPLGKSSSSLGLGALVIINEANTTGVKTISGFAQNTSTPTYVYSSLTGEYFASAAITTVTITLSTGTFTAAGTVSLYGVAA